LDPAGLAGVLRAPVAVFRPPEAAVFLAPAPDFAGFREAELLFAPLLFLAPDELVVRDFDRARGFRSGAIASYTILGSSDPRARDLVQALPVAIST
jgi:hypothetical protein